MSNFTAKASAFLLSLLAVNVLQSAVHAADFCVRDAAEFQTVLTESQFNGVDDHIRLSTDGAIALSAAGLAYDSDSVPQAIWIEGGYDSECTVHDGVRKTILDLAAVTTPLGIVMDPSFGSVTISDVAIKNKPDTAGSSGSALAVVGQQSVIVVERSAFFANRGTSGSAFQLRSAGGSIEVTDSVVHGNVTRKWSALIAGGATQAQRAQTCVFSGNTVTINVVDPNVDEDAAIAIVNCDSTVVSSTLFDDNVGADLVLRRAGGATLPQDALLDSNNIQELDSGDVAVVQSGTITVPVDLGVNPFKLFLPADSPLVDAGAPGAASPGETDFLGRLRVVGARRDIGAFEHQTALFTDGFE